MLLLLTMVLHTTTYVTPSFLFYPGKKGHLNVLCMKKRINGGPLSLLCSITRTQAYSSLHEIRCLEVLSSKLQTLLCPPASYGTWSSWETRNKRGWNSAGFFLSVLTNKEQFLRHESFRMGSKVNKNLLKRKSKMQDELVQLNFISIELWYFACNFFKEGTRKIVNKSSSIIKIYFSVFIARRKC